MKIIFDKIWDMDVDFIDTLMKDLRELNTVRFSINGREYHAKITEIRTTERLRTLPTHGAPIHIGLEYVEIYIEEEIEE